MADQPYVTFPGTAGNYIPTPDTNLLNADTAHFQQGNGTWTPLSVTLVQSPAPVFGDNVGEVVLPAVTTNLYAVSAGDPVSTGIPVSPSTEYAWSVFAAIENPTDTEFELRINFYDGGGTLLTQDIVETRKQITTSLVEYGGSATSPATAAYAVPRVVYWDVSGTGTGKGWLDAACFREGSDATFVPSLRIVGDLDIQADIAPAVWGAAPRESVAAIWTGNYWGMTDGVTPGNVRLDVLTDAGAAVAEITPGVVDGSRHILRWTVDLTNDVITGYIDGVSKGTGAAVASALVPAGGALTVGQLTEGGLFPFTGDIYSFKVRDGIDGPIVAQFDAADVGGVL